MRTGAFCRPVGARSVFCPYSRGCIHCVDFTPGCVLPPPWLGLIFPEILSLSYQASPNGAKDYSQGIHPLVNEAKFCPSPNGAAEKISVRLKFVTRNAQESLCKTKRAISFSGCAFSFSIDTALFLPKKKLMT